MRKRGIYAGLFALPGLLAALVLASLISGHAATELWQHAFGDTPWTAPAGYRPLTGFVITALLAWTAFIALGYLLGRKLEAEPGLQRSHLLLAALVTLAIMAAVSVHQLRRSTALHRVRSAHCSDFCRQNGFSASRVTSLPGGGSCACLDGHGRRIISLDSRWLN